MYSSLRRGTSAAAAIAILASLLGAGGALAQTPAPQVPVQVGPISSAFNAAAATGPLSIALVASGGGSVDESSGTSRQAVQADAQVGANPQGAQAGAQSGASSRLDVQSSPLLAAVQTRLTAAQGQLSTAMQNGVSTVRGNV